MKLVVVRTTATLRESNHDSLRFGKNAWHARALQGCGVSSKRQRLSTFNE